MVDGNQRNGIMDQDGGMEWMDETMKDGMKNIINL